MLLDCIENKDSSFKEKIPKTKDALEFGILYKWRNF